MKLIKAEKRLYADNPGIHDNGASITLSERKDCLCAKDYGISLLARWCVHDIIALKR